MIIGLTGESLAGKDSVFKRACKLASTFDLPNPERKAFADPVKRSICATLGISMDQLEQMKNDSLARIEIHATAGSMMRGSVKVKSLTIREFIQRFATEGHRDEFGFDFWLDPTLPMDTLHSDRLIIVTDISYENEVQRVKSLGGVMVRVEGVQKIKSGRDHSSEKGRESLEASYTIYNTNHADNFKNLDEQVSDLLLAVKAEQQFLQPLDEVGPANIVDMF